MKKLTQKIVNLFNSLIVRTHLVTNLFIQKIVRFLKFFRLKKAYFVAKFLNKNSTPPPPEFTKTQVF